MGRHNDCFTLGFNFMQNFRDRLPGAQAAKRLLRRGPVPDVGVVKGATSKLAQHEVVAPDLPPECPLSLDEMLDIDFDPNIALQAIAAAVNASTAKHGR